MELLIIMNFYIIIPILILVTKIINSGSLQGEHGSAEFATYSQVQKMNLLGNKNVAFPLVEYKGERLKTLEPLSVLVLAPPGTGKSVFAIDVLLKTDQSFLILDIKGEIHKATAKFREKYFKNDILIFNPLRDDSLKFNPFAENILSKMSWNKISAHVKFVAEILYPITDGGDNYFPLEGKATFVGIALYLIQTNGYTSIPKIRSFLLQDWKKSLLIYFESLKEDYISNLSNEEKEKKYNIRKLLNLNDDKINELKKSFDDDSNIGTFINNIILPNETLHRQIKESFAALKGKSVNELGGILGSCKNGLNAFDDDSILENMDENEFDILEMRKKKISLYIVIAEDQVKLLSPIIKLFMEYTAITLLSEEPNKKVDNKVIIIFDEFPRFGKLEYIISLPALGRGYFVIVILIAQDYAQIKETYSQEKIEIINSTTAYKIIYPQMNLKTAETISNMIGKTTKEHISYSRSKSGNSISHSLTGMPLISPQDILSQDSNIVYLIVFKHYKNPIKANPLKWYEDKELLAKLKVLENDKPKIAQVKLTNINSSIQDIKILNKPLDDEINIIEEQKNTDKKVEIIEDEEKRLGEIIFGNSPGQIKF
jgi:type IV secretion system protein VirD4